MSFTPAVVPANVMQQGGFVFPWTSQWQDVIQTSSTPVSYNVTALRAAAGLDAGQPLFVVFAADGPFYANYNGAAALPSGNTTNGTASDFSPNQRYIDSSITAISFVSTSAQNVSMQWYRP